MVSVRPMTPDGVDPSQFAPGTSVVDGVAQVGMQLATTASSYQPGTTYVPSTTVGVSTSPVVNPYAPVAGETLYTGYRQYSLSPRDVNSMSAGRNQAMPTQVRTYETEIVTIDSIREEIFTLEESKLKDIQKKLGVKPTGFADPETVDQVDWFLGYVSEINASGVRESWQQVLNRLTDGGKESLAGSGAVAAEPFTGEKTTTQTDVRLLSPSEARGMAEQAFVAAIGREPSKGELAAFRSAMNDASRSDPAQTTTTTQYEEGDAVSSHSVTEGGVEFSQLAMDEARSQEGFAEYQAVGYMAALEDAISASGGA